MSTNSTPTSRAHSNTERPDGQDHWAKAFFKSQFFGPPTGGLRIKFFLTGCIFPALSVAFIVISQTTPPTIDQPWQSGKFEHYIAMFLDWTGLLIFLPLILFSASSLAAWLIWPKLSRLLVVRLGIYSGVFLAGQYLYFIVITSSVFTFIFAAIIAPILALAIFILGFFVKRYRRFTILHLILLTTVVAIALGVIQLTDGWERILGSPIVIAAATPTLNFATYLRAAFMIIHEQIQPTHPRPTGMVSRVLAIPTLLVAWFVSWKIAVDVATAEYAKLPTTDPNCYLSAAANHRHAWLFHKPDQQVSLQTKRLKFLEITLRCAAPEFHAALRKLYDRQGPALASFCKGSRLFATLTYFWLLPLEAIAEIMRYLIRVPSARIKQIYSSE